MVTKSQLYTFCVSKLFKSAWAQASSSSRLALDATETGRAVGGFCRNPSTNQANWQTYIYTYIYAFCMPIYFLQWSLSYLGFPGGSDGKESACSVEYLGLIPSLGRSPGEETGYPLQHSCLENSLDRVAWRVTVHGVAKSRAWLSE